MNEFSGDNDIVVVFIFTCINWKITHVSIVEIRLCRTERHKSRITWLVSTTQCVRCSTSTWNVFSWIFCIYYSYQDLLSYTSPWKSKTIFHPKLWCQYCYWFGVNNKNTYVIHSGTNNCHMTKTCMYIDFQCTVSAFSMLMLSKLVKERLFDIVVQGYRFGGVQIRPEPLAPLNRHSTPKILV